MLPIEDRVGVLISYMKLRAELYEDHNFRLLKLWEGSAFKG